MVDVPGFGLIYRCRNENGTPHVMSTIVVYRRNKTYSNAFDNREQLCISTEMICNCLRISHHHADDGVVGLAESTM
eukprot:5282148-Pleurochrysis_carterae.AAC.1